MQIIVRTENASKGIFTFLKFAVFKITKQIFLSSNYD